MNQVLSFLSWNIANSHLSQLSRRKRRQIQIIFDSHEILKQPGKNGMSRTCDFNKFLFRQFFYNDASIFRHSTTLQVLEFLSIWESVKYHESLKK